MEEKELNKTVDNQNQTQPILANKYDFKEVEPKWQKFWQENEIYKFDLNSSKKVFSIDTPPPTVSGDIHIGHIFSYSQADFLARYKRMVGYNVFLPFGFDNNGLPTERRVEQDRNIRAHNMSREEFRDICTEVANNYQEKFKNVFIKAGHSADWGLLYSTVSPEVQRASQKSFLELAKKGLAYYGEKPAIWCPECRVSIAQAELESKDLPSTFNYLKFKLADGSGEIEIATTRPEMLCACDCVFVHPQDERFIKFIGKSVFVPLYNFEVPVMADEMVAMDKGTGAVMCCTFGDETDLAWQEKYKLPIKIAIDDGGRMTELAGEKYKGLKIKKAREEIIKDLLDGGYIYKQENIIHAVSTHERCGTPMEINIKKQWFIDLVNHKQDFLDIGEKVNWHPSYMKGRYRNWVENIDRDWCISRQRYFGVPIPVWYCKKCGEIIYADERQLPVNPLTAKPLMPCKCGSTDFEPEVDVFDTWQTSSITPLINAKWADNSELMNKIYPFSLRPNAHDIIRTWDFYTIVKSFYHTNNLPWNNVMISGFVMADKDNKISKSKSNAKFSPEILITERSADITRYWAATGSLGRDIVFSEDEFKNGAKLVNKLWNASKFAISLINDYKLTETIKEKFDSLLPVDKWLFVKFWQMQKYFINYFDNYEIGLALGELEKFFWNFCDNYIEIAKRRLYNPDIYGVEATNSAKFTIFYVLQEMLKLFSIFMPHVTEEIYQAYFKQYVKAISIHTTEIVTCPFDGVDESLIQLGDMLVDVVSSIRRYKTENGMSQKEELSKVVLCGYNELKIFEVDIKAVGTILNLVFEQGDNKIEIYR